MKDLPVVFNTRSRIHVLFIVIFAILCMVSQPVIADKYYGYAETRPTLEWTEETVNFNFLGSVTLLGKLTAKSVTINYSRPDSGDPFMLKLGEKAYTAYAIIKNSTINLSDGTAGKPLIWVDKDSELEFYGVTFNQKGSFGGVLLRTGQDDGNGGTIEFWDNNTFNDINADPGIDIRNNGEFIVANGTTTFKNSKLKLHDNGSWTIEKDAKLVFDNTTVSLNNNAEPVFLVKSGGVLEFKNGSIFDLTRGLSEDTSGLRHNRTAVKVEKGGKLIIDGSEISGANTGNDKAFITAEGGVIEITNGSKIENNTNISNSGNIIRMNGGSLLIENSMISDNNANIILTGDTEKNLGVISANGTAIEISGSTISRNGCLAAGAIFAYQPESFTVTGSIFSNNLQSSFFNDTSHGGAAIHVLNGSLTLGKGNEFLGNEAAYGGAIRMQIVDDDYTGKAKLTIAGDNIFSGNIARRSGGAIHQTGGELVIGTDDEAVNFVGNTADFEDIYFPPYGYGGAICGEAYKPEGSVVRKELKVTINNANFERNKSSLHGGAVILGSSMLNEPFVTAEIRKAQFIENEVTRSWYGAIGGGALFLYNDAHLKMSKAAIVENESDNAGGAIASGPDGTVKIRIRNGAAIFRNRAGNTVASAYPDIYLMTSDPKHEISEKMFNGGFHRWNIKDNVSVKALDDQDKVVTHDNGSYYGSDPTNTDYTGYQVLFIGNKSAGINGSDIRHNADTDKYIFPVIDYLGYGGAIGTNGLLEIGEVSESVVMLKHWKSDAEAIRPSYADFLNNWVTLKQNGEAYTAFGKFTLSHIVPDTENNTETAYLNVENDPFVLAEVLYNRTAKTWRITIDGLPLLPDVQKAWSIEEKTSAGEGYKGTPVTPPGTGIDYEITNEAVITISGKKVWKNDTEADRPESVTIHLYQEGVEEEIGHTTAQAPDWTWRFTDLPKYDNNEEEIQYIIEESAVDNYSHVERIREEDGTWTITNTHTEGQTILEVRKAWEDNEHYKDMFRPESVTVQLLRFDRETETWVEVPDAVLTLNHGNAWEGIFEYLPEYEEIGGSPVRIQYSVAEIDAPEGYTVTGPFGDMTDGFEITNTEITTVEVPVRKVWEDPDTAHAAVTVILDPAGAELTLSEENDWTGTFTDLPKYDRDGILIQYTVRELRVPGYTTEIRFDRETGEFVITNNRNGERPGGPQFFVFELPELPRTGFSAVRPTALAEQPLNLRYALSGMTLEIPSLDVSADIVEVPYADNEYAIDWLDERVGLLEGTMVPGEGISILTGHNHLNTMEAGPFAFLKFLNEGDMIFVRERSGGLQSFRVYAAEKIGAADTAKLMRIAMQDENSLTLLTCEDELPDGGYASRRVVAARPAEQ